MGKLGFKQRNYSRFLVVIALGIAATATTARAELTAASGTAYDSLCLQRGVPLPPNFGGSIPSTYVGANNGWTYNGQLALADGNGVSEEQSFNGFNTVDIFYSVSTSPSGICMAAPRNNNGGPGTDFFGVICQGTNGKVCFWDQAPSCTTSGTPAPCFGWSIGHMPGVVIPPTKVVIASSTQSTPDFIGGALLPTGPQG